MPLSAQTLILLLLTLLLSPQLRAKSELKKNDYAYAVWDLDQKTWLATHRPQAPEVLASVSKIFSAAYLLGTLGPTHRFTTEIYLQKNSGPAEAKKGITLKGGGDPFLTAKDLLDLIFRLKPHGVRFAGPFLVDDSLLPTRERISPLGLPDQADNPSLSALSVEFNRFRWQPQGAKPPLDYLHIKPSSQALGPGEKLRLQQKNPQRESWLINPQEQLKFDEEFPVRQSSLFTAHFFKELAALQGIQLSPPQKGSARGEKIVEHQSLPLERLVALGLEYSNNLIMELPYQLAKQEHPELLPWLKKHYPTVDWKKTGLQNASGLTLENQTTPHTMVQFLAALDEQSGPARPLLSLLPMSGHSGAIGRRLPHRDEAYRILAKSGSLHFVNNLAGILTTHSGKRLAFAIFTTNRRLRALLNQKNSPQVHQARQQADPWYTHSSTFIDQWLQKLVRDTF